MTAPIHRARRTLILLAKLGLAAAILGYLFVQVHGQAGFLPAGERTEAMAHAGGRARLHRDGGHAHVRPLARADHGARAQRPADRLDAARRARVRAQLRVARCSIGGDFFKAFFLAKDMHGQRTEAVATVIADRVMGLLLMLLAGQRGDAGRSTGRAAPTMIKLLVHTIRLGAVGALAGVTLVLLVPALSGDWLRQTVGKVPLVGATIARLIGAVSVYREEKRYLLVAAGISLVLDVMFILSFYCVAQGLPVQSPTLAEHFVIVPAANMAGAIPATPSGLGTMEARRRRALPGHADVRRRSRPAMARWSPWVSGRR